MLNVDTYEDADVVVVESRGVEHRDDAPQLLGVGPPIGHPPLRYTRHHPTAIKTPTPSSRQPATVRQLRPLMLQAYRNEYIAMLSSPTYAARVITASGSARRRASRNATASQNLLLISSQLTSARSLSAKHRQRFRKNMRTSEGMRRCLLYGSPNGAFPLSSHSDSTCQGYLPKSSCPAYNAKRKSG